MFDILRLRVAHGKQYISNIKKAKINPKFKGYPRLNDSACLENCHKCTQGCPTQAINEQKLTIDLGKCIFCGDCERICPQQAIQFTNFHKTGSTNRDYLVIDPGKTPEIYLDHAIQVNQKIKKIFGNSLKLRQVSAGGCNACEMELAACGNVNFDMGRFGIEFVASPRHADGIVITGPVSKNMKAALNDCYHSVPSPKLVIVAGTCAISGGVFSPSPAIDREFFANIPVDLYIPGCPIHPLTFINALLQFLGK